ncbi:5-(carboxyamino)imidazole ribonucleotide synthase [Shewanella sp. SNU WT4]|uniref:5-(carboxyamino)imidazole ribonucleotide synthase n=1 Tax=Shewanella sp. SNU WT4 TaxID=2590015 RepID=UPI0011286221|nr:5-(carboxyamino)imidazole ribonucleotide synthase [Shewanella sp. SNU WT4]QDF67807.1 5-(carboxyamino)imidazole ribonucleotide synthase [Shewanella sp. SNU WT4]
MTSISMPNIWVLGDGQLGAMMKHAGQPLGLNITPVDIMTPSDARLPLGANDLITAEREQWPESSLSLQLSQHPHFINGGVFTRLADRYSQKSLLDDIQVATAPWRLVDSNVSNAELFQQLGERVLLKRRTGGYDGKGQHWLNASNNSAIPNDWRELSIAEQAIAFDEEVSLVGARDANGQCHFYPLMLNLHQDGILMATLAPLARLKPLQAKAQAMLSRIMNSLDYVGVMAMECFRLGDDLLVNELAPRVHNSGHWTQMGCHINQFELHLRALANLAIPELSIKCQVAMVNLIGVEYDPRWLSLANTELYWYGKEVRPGRKVGHLNINATDPERLSETLKTLKLWLPSQYQAPLTWLDDNK